jgi:hypothetical protein
MRSPNAWNGCTQDISRAMNAKLFSALHGYQLVSSSYMFSMDARSCHDSGKRFA